MYIFYRKNLDPWLDKKSPEFSRFCMKVLRVDLDD